MLVNLGSVYSALERYDESLDYLHQALEMCVWRVIKTTRVTL